MVEDSKWELAIVETVYGFYRKLLRDCAQEPVPLPGDLHLISLGELEGEENNPTCDLSCEAELRSQMGFGPEREAEFRNQLTLARHEIGHDKVWNSTLPAALQAAGLFCDLQRQKAQIFSKGVVSQPIRDSVNSRFVERERNLISQYKNSAGLLTQRVQTVQRFAPFRATVMQYQWNEATARVCPDYTLP